MQADLPRARRGRAGHLAEIRVRGRRQRSLPHSLGASTSLCAASSASNTSSTTLSFILQKFGVSSFAAESIKRVTQLIIERCAVGHEVFVVRAMADIIGELINPGHHSSPQVNPPPSRVEWPSCLPPASAFRWRCTPSPSEASATLPRAERTLRVYKVASVCRSRFWTESPDGRSGPCRPKPAHNPALWGVNAGRLYPCRLGARQSGSLWPASSRIALCQSPQATLRATVFDAARRFGLARHLSLQSCRCRIMPSACERLG